MKITPRSVRAGASVTAAAGLIGAAAALSPQLPAGHSASAHPVSARLDSATSSQVVCGTTGSGGSPWVQVAGPAGTELLPAGSAGGTASTVPTCPAAIGGQAAQPMSCQQAEAAASQAIQQQANEDLFSQFMLNYISNNAQGWASALASYGDTSNVPTAGSSVVSQAIQTVEAQDQNDVNALASALKSVIEQGPAFSSFCVGAGEETPQQGENDALAYAAQEQNDLDPYLEMALDAVAQEAASILATSSPSS